PCEFFRIRIASACSPTRRLRTLHASDPQWTVSRRPEAWSRCGLLPSTPPRRRRFRMRGVSSTLNTWLPRTSAWASNWQMPDRRLQPTAAGAIMRETSRIVATACRSMNDVKASVFIGTSVDGFIARTTGALDFLPPGGGEPHGYAEFMSTVDAL